MDTHAQQDPFDATSVKLSLFYFLRIPDAGFSMVDKWCLLLGDDVIHYFTDLRLDLTRQKSKVER